MGASKQERSSVRVCLASVLSPRGWDGRVRTMWNFPPRGMKIGLFSFFGGLNLAIVKWRGKIDMMESLGTIF